MPVLARVLASTRLTITAQYRLYLPSADGRLPDTTTEPEGMRLGEQAWNLLGAVVDLQPCLRATDARGAYGRKQSICASSCKTT